MTWEQYAYFAFRGFSVGFALGSFMWLVGLVSGTFSSFFRPPKLD